MRQESHEEYLTDLTQNEDQVPDSNSRSMNNKRYTNMAL